MQNVSCLESFWIPNVTDRMQFFHDSLFLRRRGSGGLNIMYEYLSIFGHLWSCCPRSALVSALPTLTVSNKRWMCYGLQQPSILVCDAIIMLQIHLARTEKIKAVCLRFGKTTSSITSSILTEKNSEGVYILVALPIRMSEKQWSKASSHTNWAGTQLCGLLGD